MLRLRFASALFAVLAPLAGPARAQFQPVAMRLSAWEFTRLGFGAMGGAGPGGDLLLVDSGLAPSTRLFHYRDLLTPRSSPYALPAESVLHATVAPFGGAAMPDLVWETESSMSANSFEIAWGAAPAVAEAYVDALVNNTQGLQPLQFLPSGQPPLLLYDISFPGTQEEFCLRDLGGARGTGVIPAARCWPEPGDPAAELFSLTEDEYLYGSRVHPVRLSLAATDGRGVVDAVIPLKQGFRVAWNRTPASATDLSGVDVVYVTVGWGNLFQDIPTQLNPEGLDLPHGIDCFGGGALDVGGDANLDLLFTMRDPLGSAPGQLLWIESDGTPATFANAGWHSLMGRADLRPLVDPAVLQQLDLPGDPVLALHDRGLDQILLLSGDGKTGFTVRRLPAFGATVREFFVADVVGGVAPDLLVWVATSSGAFELWVYPDDLDLAPSLAWNPEPPAVALVGADLPLSVDASDLDSLFTVTWIRPPAVDVTGPTTLTIPGAELCSTATVDVTVRALDELGVYVQLQRTIPVEMRPSLRLVGSEPPGRLVLAPGGASGRAEGEAWPACGVGTDPAFTWGWWGLTGLVEPAPGSVGSSASLDFKLPESAYGEALSGAPALTLTAEEGALVGTATLPLDLDARGLVRASLSFDRPVLEAGELGTLRVQLANQLSVPLPAVRARVRLEGLDFAGAMTVTGAPATLGPGEGEVVVDPLPATDATVELVVPVRSAGGPGAASVELYSAGGFRVSPEASPSTGEAVTPGCGCGAGGGELGLSMLLLFLYMNPMRRVLASTLATSSSTRITRQAWRKASTSRSGRSERETRSWTDLVPSASVRRWASLGRRPRA